MARKGPVKPRKAGIDPVYKNKLVAKLTNVLMRDGKKVLPKDRFIEPLKLLRKKN